MKNEKMMIFDRQLIAEKHYWIEQLSQNIPSSNLFLDYPRPKTFLQGEEYFQFQITGETYQNLNRLTKGSPFLTYSALLATLKIALYRYTGNTLIVVGSPACGEEVDANALAIVDLIKPSLSFKDILLKVSETLKAAYKKQRYPVTRLIQDLGREEIDNHCPLFDIAMVFKGLHGELPAMKQDITFTFMQSDEQLTGEITFNKHLFKVDTLARFLTHFINILEAGLANYNDALLILPLLSEEEPRKILSEWKQRQADYPDEQYLHHEEDVKKIPDAIAVNCELSQPLISAELNSGANQLAFKLPTIAKRREDIMEARHEHPISSSPIQPIIREQALPLSFAQERLWFLHQLEPDNPFYTISISLELKGVLNEKALKKSFQEIVRRHESLRTTFLNDQVAIVNDTFKVFSMPVVNFLPVEALAQAEAVKQFVQKEAQRPFDLAKGPLFRTTLLKVNPETHILLLTIHHIIADSCSLGIFVKELPPLYDAFLNHAASPLPELAIQYADFAAWQRQWGEVLETQLTYWKQQLADAPQVLHLPTVRPRPAEQRFRGSSEQFEINPELTHALKVLSQRHGATFFMTLLAAFATLLYRYSDQADMVIGSPIANRNRLEIEDLIGFFVNTLALRIDFAENPSFIELQQQVRKVALDAYAHQDLPFEKLVDELQIERDLSINPLFQVMFALNNMPMGTLALPDLTLTPIPQRRIAALFDIVLELWETESGLLGVLEYNTDLFDAATIVRMVGHFKTLLASIAAAPEEAVSTLPLLTESEKQHLLSMGKGACVDYPVEQPLHRLFEQQVAATPDRIAAVHVNKAIRYNELNQRANQIAHSLRDIGVQRHDFVGILVERGLAYLASLLGILKAGAAFVPLDPSYPEERVRYMITDSQLQTLVTHRSLFKNISTDWTSSLRQVCYLDNFESRLNDNIGSNLQVRPYERYFDWLNAAITNPEPVNAPSDIAYMLYTSGSTGLPKGAMVRHNGAVNHIYAEFEALAFHDNTAFLQSAPSSSDISVWQFLAPLLIGGRTVIVDFETVCDPSALFSVIQSQQITLIELVPVVMQGLLNQVVPLSSEVRALPYLEWAMVTGEAVSVTLVNEWLDTYPHIKLLNAYGPTEAADDICQALLDKPLSSQEHNVPIGKPIPNLTLYVLDQHHQLLPIGVYGEIAVAGIGVGAGYWGNPEKTAKQFVQNPYSDNFDNQIIYKTGDLGRWLPDGSLEFIGRFDHQVKLRGFRIELGEIEGVLSQHPAVKERLVIDSANSDGEKQLIAYLVANLQDDALQALHAKHVSLWQALHDKSYQDSPSHADPTFNIIGWDSTYTGFQLSDEEMQECVETTVDKILSLNPQHVLEIGCGTGLLMYRIVSHCVDYVGTELSKIALQQLEESKRFLNIKGLEHTTLLTKSADDFEGFEAQVFDTLIINSVVQYFPSIDYLLTVLKGALNVVKPGAKIFIGDVRSLPLLKAYHASVQVYKAVDFVTRSKLAARIQDREQQEQELIINPLFFVALKEVFPEISRVKIEPKRGLIRNEMTRFRYDVILEIQGPESDASKEQEIKPLTEAIVWEDWEQKPFTLLELAQRLICQQPSYVALRHVGNGRITTEINALEWLYTADDNETVGDLRDALVEIESKRIDPEALWEICFDLPYDIEIQFSLDRADGSYDALLIKQLEKESNSVSLSEFQFLIPPSVHQNWHEYANHPLQEQFTQQLLPQLREFMKAKLPDYMMPSAFVILNRFPLTPNGKIDRAALPEAQMKKAQLAGDIIAPSNTIEESLVAIWADILDLAKIGTHHNFFELGGHSLKATQVINRIHEDLGIEVPLRDIFNYPTIAELAQKIARLGLTAYQLIEPIPDAEHYALSHAQHRLWVLSQMADSNAAYSMSEALLLTGKIEAEWIEQAFMDLVQRHESLRTRFITVEGEARQRVDQEITARVFFKDLTTEANPRQAAEQFAYEHATEAFDLEKGPLIRIALLTLGKDQYALLLHQHHIISDDWSLDILAREFIQIYSALRQGEQANLPALRIQYRDYAHWQNQLLASATADRDYWHQKLAGELPILDLPIDFPRPAVKSYCGKRFQTFLPTTLALQQFNQQHQVSLFMTLVALVKVLLYRYTAQTDILIGCPVAGRNQLDLEKQIGFYVNTLVLRDTISGDMRFCDFLQQVKQTATEAYKHQNYPFDRLVQELKMPHDVSRSPVFDVMIVLQNVDNIPFSLDGVQIEPLEFDSVSSQFDITFSFEEKPNGLEIRVSYNTALFLAERISNISEHLQTLISHILVDDTQPLAQL